MINATAALKKLELRVVRTMHDPYHAQVSRSSRLRH